MPGPAPVVVDANLGLGGHAEALLAAHPALHLIGIDRDPSAIERVHASGSPRTPTGPRWSTPSPTSCPRCSPGSAPPRRRRRSSTSGVSSPQLDEAERGFAYSYDAPLDMRMDRDQELTAERCVNTYSAAELTRILRDYGEERFARVSRSLIIKERAKDAITSTKRLAEIVRDGDPGRHPAHRGQPGQAHFPGAAHRGERGARRPGARRCPPRSTHWRSAGGSSCSRTTPSRTG